MRKFLSIIVPAYNEERRIADCLRSLITWLKLPGDKTTPDNTEIVVVANGCTDRTEQIVYAYTRAYPKLVRLVRSPIGKGAAVRAGMLSATGEIRMFADVDLAVRPDQFGLLIEPVLFDRYDVAIAVREGPGAVRYNEPWQRHAAGRVYNTLVRSLALPGLVDTQCGFKAFDAKTALDLFPRVTIHGWAFDVEVLYIARKLGYSIGQVPVCWVADSDSRVRLVQDSVRMFGDIMQIRKNDQDGLYGVQLKTTAARD